MTASSGILMCGHGTRRPEGVRGFAALSAKVRAACPGVPVEHGFLELSEPSLAEALDSLRAQGVDDVRVVPGMLLTAGHLKRDIPEILDAWSARNPGVRVRLGRALGVDLRMVRAAIERIEAALDDRVPRAETALLFVGRGSSDADANGDGAKLARMVLEGSGLGWAQTAYFDVAAPRVDAALDMTARLGFRRVVGLPYLLFAGILAERFDECLAQARRRHPAVEFVGTDRLGDHPLVVDTFVDRAREIAAGPVAMNCLTCAYRANAPGHHHDHDHCDDHHHNHSHGGGR